MNDMRSVIIPKSDQLNADDLLAGPRTITVERVTIRPGTEQPVSINFEGDGGKPYKPCKSMARVMVHAWGPDANEYVGRSMTLYCDPKVKWGGMEVGGIRISRMSHIDGKMVLALTETKGRRQPYTVHLLKPSQMQQQAKSPPSWIEVAANKMAEVATDAGAWVGALLTALAECPSGSDLTALAKVDGVENARKKAPKDIRDRIEAAFKSAGERLADAPAEDGGDAGWNPATSDEGATTPADAA